MNADQLALEVIAGLRSWREAADLLGALPATRSDIDECAADYAARCDAEAKRRAIAHLTRRLSKVPA